MKIALESFRRDTSKSAKKMDFKMSPKKVASNSNTMSIMAFPSKDAQQADNPRRTSLSLPDKLGHALGASH